MLRASPNKVERASCSESSTLGLGLDAAMGRRRLIFYTHRLLLDRNAKLGLRQGHVEGLR